MQTDHDVIHQKDLFEAVGFSNGKKPWTDGRAIGIMGLNLVKNFFYRVEVFYIDAKKALEHNKVHGTKIKKYYKNHLIENLLIIS